LQKNADEHIHRVRVKVRNDHIWWLPRTGPPWLPHSERDPECAHGIERPALKRTV
jgi:hypothetical protein